MESLVNCNICNNQYEDPIVLPCSKTVCSKHVYSDQTKKVFKCELCKGEHIAEKESFPTDKTMVDLLKICSKYIDISNTAYETHYDTSEILSKQLNDLFKEAQLLKNDPFFFIDDYFFKLRNKIDISKEEKIRMIVDHHEELINQANELEKECKSKLNLNADKSLETEQLKNLAQNLIINDLCEETQFFRIQKLDNNYWNQRIQRQKKEIEKTKYLIKKAKSELMLNKDYSFIEDSLGTLLITGQEIEDETRLTGTVRFVIDNFSKFKYTKEFCESIQYVVVGNVPWRLKVIIVENEHFELNLNVFIGPDCQNETFESNPIYISAFIRILKHKIQITFKEDKLKYKFEEKIGYGFEALISLNEILKESNEIYNKEEDSITIECEINILNETEFNDFCE